MKKKNLKLDPSKVHDELIHKMKAINKVSLKNVMNRRKKQAQPSDQRKKKSHSVLNLNRNSNEPLKKGISFEVWKVVGKPQNKNPKIKETLSSTYRQIFQKFKQTHQRTKSQRCKTPGSRGKKSGKQQPIEIQTNNFWKNNKNYYREKRGSKKNVGKSKRIMQNKKYNKLNLTYNKSNNSLEKQIKRMSIKRKKQPKKIKKFTLSSKENKENKNPNFTTKLRTQQSQTNEIYFLEESELKKIYEILHLYQDTAEQKDEKISQLQLKIQSLEKEALQLRSEATKKPSTTKKNDLMLKIDESLEKLKLESPDPKGIMNPDWGCFSFSKPKQGYFLHRGNPQALQNDNNIELETTEELGPCINYL